MAIITCETCQSVFEGRPNRKYCSPECKRKAEMDVRISKRKKAKRSAADWSDLPTWEPTPEEQKVWEDEMASLPTLEEMMDNLDIKGPKRAKKGKKTIENE